MSRSAIAALITMLLACHAFGATEAGGPLAAQQPLRLAIGSSGASRLPATRQHALSAQRLSGWQQPPARRLHQYTDSRTGGRVKNKDDLTVAATDNAEAVSHPRSGGITHNQASVVALSSDRYPAGMSRVATDDLYAHQGAVELQVAAFGPVAAAVTDTNVGAFSGTNAMAIAEHSGTPGTSRANTMSVLDPNNPLTGAPRRRAGVLGPNSGGPGGGGVSLQSIGTNTPASKAFAMSEMGDGPHAIAHAGEAVATAYSSTDNDDEGNGDNVFSV